jgi:hypothetical protein
MRVTSFALPVAFSGGRRSATKNAVFLSGFILNFQSIHDTVYGPNFESFGLIICNRAFCQIVFRYTKRTRFQAEAEVKTKKNDT